MLQPGGPAMLGFGAFSIFAVLGGLVLLAGADHSAPGCTGPQVQRCDFVEVATRALASDPGGRRFETALGFEFIDKGSSVQVQQYLKDHPSSLFEGPAVLIDKRSCRPCSIGVREALDEKPTFNASP